MLTLVDRCQLRVSRVSVRASVWPPTYWQSERKLCPDKRGRSGPEFGFLLYLAFAQKAPKLLNIIDEGQLRVVYG